MGQDKTGGVQVDDFMQFLEDLTQKVCVVLSVSPMLTYCVTRVSYSPLGV